MDEGQQRSYIAEILIGFSLLAISCITLEVIYNKPDNATAVFNSLLPLFGTWIGTVLAYYFSRSNFETATNAYKNITQAGNKADITPVTAAMLDVTKIGGVQKIAQGRTATDIKIQDMLTSIVPPISRICVLDVNGCVLYILHENTLNKFVTRNMITPPVGGFIIAQATLQMLIDDKEFGSLARLYKIIASTETVASAKKTMDETPGCEDIFVTKGGGDTEPVVGWITDDTFKAYDRI